MYFFSTCVYIVSYLVALKVLVPDVCPVASICCLAGLGNVSAPIESYDFENTSSLIPIARNCCDTYLS